MSGVLIIGAGGHAKVVADILQACGAGIIGFLDDNPQAPSRGYLNLPILGRIDDYARHNPDALIWGLGGNRVRQIITERLGDAATPLWGNAIHPRATIAPTAVIGRGVVVAAHAVLNPDTVLGDHVIVNTGATVDHDCAVGDFAHIAPGTHLAGAVVVEAGAFLGVGTSVIPGITIGAWSTLGAGSVVLRDIPPNAMAYGVPAKVKENLI